MKKILLQSLFLIMRSLSVFPENATKKILFEINEIDQLLDYADPLIRICLTREPDFVELMAASSLLHSFYNGIENILVVIAKECDGTVPHGVKWHKALLLQMRENGKRGEILSGETIEKMNEYLLFRHSYSFRLNWDDMKVLVIDLLKVWAAVKKDITNAVELNG